MKGAMHDTAWCFATKNPDELSLLSEWTAVADKGLVHWRFVEEWPMKARDSGMPDETWWSSFFEPDGLLARMLAVPAMAGAVFEFDCGYETFTLPAARLAPG